MTLPLIAAAYLDGVRIADTAAEYTAGVTTALAGASVSWGRSDTMTQPDSASASVRLVRRGAAASSFLATLRTGHRLDITATGALYPDPTLSTFLDPGFETGNGPHTPPTAGAVAPRPKTVRTNLVTNPSFELGTAPGWATSGLTGVTSTLTVPVSGGVDGGRYVRRVLTGGAAPGSAVGIHVLSTYLPVNYFETVIVVMYARAGGGVTKTRARIDFYNQNGANYIGQALGPYVALDPVEWRPIAVTYRVPQYANIATISTYNIAADLASNNGPYIELDHVMFTQGTDTAYFDGSTTDTVSHDYAWTGAAHNSTSTDTATYGGKWFAATATDPNPRAGLAVILAPAPFVPSGTAPDAWDAIPATSAGQRWSVGATITAPVGSTVEVRAVTFAGPWADAATVQESPRMTFWADGFPHQLAATLVAPNDGEWVGIRVSSSPTGLTWAYVDSRLTWVGSPAAATWASYGTIGIDDVQVLAPVGGTSRTALVFSGRITDLEAGFDTGTAEGAVTVDITAQDFTADLNNIRIGDAPWIVERLDTRVNRVLTLAGTGIAATVDASVAPTLVTYRDVDSQPAAGLITELAASVDAVAWAATHQVTGPYYRIEDPAQRPSLSRLVEGADGVIRIEFASDIAGAAHLSACDLLLDPVRWEQDVSDVTTRIDVSWLEQGIDAGEVTTTDRHAVIIDPGLEGIVGQRGVSLSTQLQSSTDALTVATKLMSRTSVQGWRLSGITWVTRYASGDDAAHLVTALDLLDGTTRIGAPLVVDDLPPWSPRGPEVASYVEGGTYTVDDTGAWILDLTVSATLGGVGGSAAWSALPVGWLWTEFDPGISWVDLRGVGVG